MPARGQKKKSQPVGDMGDPQGFAALIALFLEWQQVRGYSEYTVFNRQKYLNFFALWCQERSLMQPKEITRPIIERYQRHLYHHRRPDGRPLSFGGQRVRLVPLRAFFKWLARNNYILYNPTSEMEMPRVEKRLPKHILTVSEVERVLNSIDTRTGLGVRDRAMIETLYSTGIRRMELANLELRNIDAERGTVMVRQGKGKKDRMIPIGERALAWIAKYMSEVRPGIVVEPDNGMLFLTNTGEQFAANRLTQLVAERVDEAQIGKRGSCHLFRHTMATLMLENGADVRFIQAMLGHADLSTTQLYTQVSIRKLKEIHTATHPAKARRASHLEDAEADGEASELLAQLEVEAAEESD